MNDTQLLALADANQAEFAREHARWLPPTHIHERTGLLLTAAGLRAPGPWNAVIGLGAEPADPKATLTAAAEFFDPIQHHCAVYVREHLDVQLELACRERGYELGSDAPGMVLRRPSTLHPLAGMPMGLQLQLVNATEHARELVEVVAHAYETLQMPPAITRTLLSKPERWLRPHYETFLLREEAHAVAGAQLLWSHGIAGMYWVATLPQARKRGHAERVTRAVCHHAFERGARAVVLQASRGAETIYRRVGFKELTRYRTYRRPPQRAQAPTR